MNTALRLSVFVAAATIGCIAHARDPHPYTEQELASLQEPKKAKEAFEICRRLAATEKLPTNLQARGMALGMSGYCAGLANAAQYSFKDRLLNTGLAKNGKFVACINDLERTNPNSFAKRFYEFEHSHIEESTATGEAAILGGAVFAMYSCANP